FTTLTGGRRTTVTRLGPLKWPMFGLIAAYLVVSLIIPTVLLIMATFMKFFGAFDVKDPWTLTQWNAVLTDATFAKSLVDTLILGLRSALLAVVWFSFPAYTIARYRGFSSRLLDFFCWLPWAIPGVIMGLGFLWMVLGIRILQPLHSTMAI